MANAQQQRSFYRKISYIAAIVVLFGATWFFRSYVLQARAYELALVEESKGEVELGGSAVRLMLTGSRGFAVCVLWLSWGEAQKRNEWNKVELITRYITKLQPHFVSPWLFQSWNIAYNVSHEAHRPRDKYYYMARGIEMLAEGERRNSNNPEMRWHIAFYYQQKIGLHDEKDMLQSLFELSCIDPLERDPARFYSYQWTDLASSRARADGVPTSVLDRLKTLREEQISFPRQDLLQSEIKERLDDKQFKRYGDKIVRSARVLKPQKFISFCQNHPQLVRRLHDKVVVHLTNHTHKDPNEVIEFLEENRDVPSLYSTNPKDVDGLQEEQESDSIPSKKTRKLEDTERFPILPRPRAGSHDKEEITSDDVLRDDNFDTFIAARSWYSYSLEPLPDPSDQRPGLAKPVENRITQHMPKRMRSILYRMCPPRAQNYVCDRLADEGWFGLWDLSPAFDMWEWVDDEGTVHWIDRAEPSDSKHADDQDRERLHARSVGSVGHANILKETWHKDYRMWNNLGKENYFLIPDEEMEKKLKLRDRFNSEYPNRFQTPFSALATRREDMPPDLVAGYDAAVFIYYLQSSLKLSNFNSFFYRAQVEKEDLALQARRFFFEGDDRTKDSSLRIQRYAAGLQIWRDILDQTPSLRDDTTIQQELFEYQLKYLYHLQQLASGGQLVSQALLVQELLGSAAAAPENPGLSLLGVAQLEHSAKNNRDWPAPAILGTLDEFDEHGDYYVSDASKEAVSARFAENARRAGRPPKPKKTGGPSAGQSTSGLTPSTIASPAPPDK
jgi:hypothetical protein